MKRKVIINIGGFKKVFSAFIIFLVYSTSFSFAESRVIIEGNASITIDSQSQETKLIASNIETTHGGRISNINSNSSIEEFEVQINESIVGGFVIEKAYPNPFNPTTNIKYGIGVTSDVDIAIFDMRGRLVNTYRINAQYPGWHEFTWNGTNSKDQLVSTGMYLVTMRAGNKIKKQKVTYLK